MTDFGTSYRPAGVTAHVMPARFFVPDTHESRRPSYASSTSKYSQATPRPINYAAFSAVPRKEARSSVAQPVRFHHGKRAHPRPAVQQPDMTHQSLHGSLAPASEARLSLFESPRPAPRPGARPHQEGPPLAYENHPRRQTRSSSLSNAFKDGIQKISTIARRRSSVSKESIQSVKNSFRGDTCGLGERISAEESVKFMQEAQARGVRKRELELRAEVERFAKKDGTCYPHALPPKRGLRRVQARIGQGPRVPVETRKMRTLSGRMDRFSALGPLLHAGPQWKAGIGLVGSARKMRTLSGRTDRLESLGPLIDAGPHHLKSFALRAEAEQSSISRTNRRRLGTGLDEQDRARKYRSADNYIWWQGVDGRSEVGHGKSIQNDSVRHTVVCEAAAPHTDSSNGARHTIKRKPLSQQSYPKVLSPGLAASGQSAQQTRLTGETMVPEEQTQEDTGNVDYWVVDAYQRDSHTSFVVVAAQQAERKLRGQSRGLLS